MQLIYLVTLVNPKGEKWEKDTYNAILKQFYYQRYNHIDYRKKEDGGL